MTRDHDTPKEHEGFAEALLTELGIVPPPLQRPEDPTPPAAPHPGREGEPSPQSDSNPAP